MNVLSIGNSFSEDATRYLNGIAKEAGVNLTTVNLCIGGCSLFRHFQNVKNDAKAYTLQYNGVITGFSVSLKEGLLNREWDVITVQQVSNQSPRFSTFQPYLNELVAYCRELCPKAKIVLQQTWAYEKDSKRLTEEMKYTAPIEMLNDVKNSYLRAAEEIGAAGIIPSGEMLHALLENGIPSVHRDTFHASLGLGRYALGLLWLRMLTGKTVTGNTFSAFDKPVTDGEKAIAQRVVDSFKPIFD
jgi:hypothetical protein